MAENRIDIMLEMIDRASPEFRKVNADMIKQVKSLEDSSKKATNSFQDGLKKVNKEVRDLRTAFLGLSVGIALAIKSVNDLSKYNKDSKNTMDLFNKSATTLSATLGVVFKPAIEGLTVVINLFRDSIVAAIAGFIKLFSFTFEFLAELPAAFKNIFDNIKNFFTKDEDPVGIIDGFKKAFDSAVNIANIATDQIIEDFNKTKEKINVGNDSEDIEERKINLESLRDLAIKIEEDIANAAKKQAEAKKKYAKESANSIVNTLQILGEKNKAVAIAAKAVAFTSSVVNAIQAGTKAAAETGSPVYGLIVKLSQLAEAAAIASIGFAKGTDSVPAMLTPGEMVVPRDFASAVRSGDISIGGRGGSGSFGDINIYIQGGIRQDGDSVSRMAEKLGFEFERQLRTARGF
jgi:hypothetical protein